MRTIAVDLRRARTNRLLGLGATTGQQTGTLIAAGSGVAGGILSLMAGQQQQSSNSSDSSDASALGTAAAVVPIVGAILGLVSDFVGKGCGNACIESSQQEQVYEVAADICAHAVVLGMIPEADWQSIKSAIQQAGTSSLTQLQQSGDKSAAGGLSNMTSVLNGLQPTAPATAAAYNFGTLEQSWLAMTNTAGWYAASLSAGEQLAEAILNQVAGSSASGVGSVISSLLPASLQSVTVLGLPLGTILVWGGIGFLVIKLL